MRSLSLALPLALLLGLAPAVRADPPAGCPELAGHLHTIVLDPGHGGTNEGAVGVAGVYERFLTLDTAKLLQHRLADCLPGARIELTRQNDVDLSLSQRAYLANALDADLFVSIHYNAAENAEAQGIEVYYLSSQEDAAPAWPDDAQLMGPSGVVVASILQDLDRTWLQEQSARLAELLLAPLVAQTGALNRGVREGRFRVLRGALMPAVVVELGFLTHSQEGRSLVDPGYTSRQVEALLQGIGAYDRSLGPAE